MAAVTEEQWTTGEAARRLGVSQGWIRRLELRGDLPPARRLARFRIYSEAEIEELRQTIAARRAQQRQTATGG